MIDGGFTGLSTALHLREAGVDVATVEQRNRVGADPDATTGRWSRSCHGPIRKTSLPSMANTEPAPIAAYDILRKLAPLMLLVYRRSDAREMA